MRTLVYQWFYEFIIALFKIDEKYQKIFDFDIESFKWEYFRGCLVLVALLFLRFLSGGCFKFCGFVLFIVFIYYIYLFVVFIVFFISVFYYFTKIKTD